MKNLPYRPCVGIMLLNKDGRIFAGRRIDSQDTQAWQMPQGGIDDGEAFERAALRELEEETGITADKVEILMQADDWVYYDLPAHLVSKMWKGRYRGQKQIWFALRFTGADTDINIATAEPEFSDWQWMKANEILPFIVPFKVEVYEQVFAQFQQFLK